jgi:hypothetical protein
MPVRNRKPNKSAWTAAEHAILARPITTGAVIKALQVELGITRSRSAADIERRTLARLQNQKDAG